jgi:glycosyltransferase involved in cell wall biosynthesis
MRRDARFELNDRHELWQFGFGGGRWIRRLLAPVHIVRLVVHCVLLVRRERIDIIRATEPTLCGVIAWATSRLTGTAYCVSLHADYDKLFELDGSRGAPTVLGSRALIKPLERFTLRRAIRVLPIRESLVPYALTRGVRPDHVRVIPHGIDLAPYAERSQIDVREELALPPRKAIIAFAGRLSPENYVHDVLSAARRLAERRDDFVVVMAGGGVLAKDVAASLQADPVLARVLCPVGFRSHDIVRELWRSAAVALCLMGGFSLIEACAAGAPVVSYDVAWHRELVIDGRTGRLVAEHHVDAVVDALDALLTDRASARQMGAEARALASARHDIAAVSRTRQRWYAEMLEA